jgi:hypothetical protein
MTRRLVLVLLAVTGLLSACAIQPEATPNDVPAERSGVFGDPTTGDVAAGSNRVFLLAPTDAEEPQRLRSVLRDVGGTPADVLQSLFAGPNADERAEQLDTAIPTDVELMSTPRTVGEILTIDLNDVFAELTPDGLRLAVGQIVTTATEIDGVRAVQLRIDGEPRVWPRGNGELTDDALTEFDFPGLVESSQPEFPGTPSPVG